MDLHHWLRWLAVNLALLWLGMEIREPPPELVAVAAFEDGYLVGPDQVATVEVVPIGVAADLSQRTPAEARSVQPRKRRLIARVARK